MSKTETTEQMNPSKLTFDTESAGQRIDEIVSTANEVASKKLEGARALIKEVKDAMSHGTDCITTSQLQEWAMAIPIICEEIVPHKEAFALMKDLWDIETKQLAARNLLELDCKKTEIDSINKIAGTENAKKRAISEYMQNILGGVQESLWMLGNAVRKILDARIASGDCR